MGASADRYRVRRRLMIVANAPAFAETLRDRLGHPAIVAEMIVSADDALAKARAEHPHLILLDIRPPGRTGAEVLASFRADPELRYLRVIVLGDSDRADPGNPLLRARVLRALTLEEVPAEERQPAQAASSSSGERFLAPPEGYIPGGG